MNKVIDTSTRLDQVKKYLLNYIEQKQLKHNDQLPSETDLAKMLGVSRNTVRETYISLENEGIIVRRHGIGTFVTHSPVLRDSLNEFAPFAQIIREGGYTPNFQTISVIIETAPDDVYQVLAVSQGVPLRHIQRIVLADQRPVIYVDDYISPEIEDFNPDWVQFDGNMVDFISKTIEIPLHHIRSRIRVGVVSPEVSQYMDLPVGTPVLDVQSTIYSGENQPLVFSKIVFNSDIVELDIVRSSRTK